VENGFLREMGDFLCSLLEGFIIPDGSVIMIGSLSHLMREGRTSYCKGMVAEFRRFNGLFKGAVHVVPFLPLPLCGSNRPSLGRAMMDCSIWLESVLEWDLKEYYNLFREFLTASGNGIAVPNQHTLEFAFPIVIGEYREKTVSCHLWHGVPEFLHPMLPTHEVKLISTLLECLGKEFKMELDITPVMSRELRVAEFTANPTTIPAVIIGRSNGDRLGAAFRTWDCPQSSWSSVAELSTQPLWRRSCQL